MRRFLRVIRTLVVKDWQAELRNLQILPLVVVLAVTAMMLFRLAEVNFDSSPLAWAALLWIITLLDLVIILDRTLAADAQNGVLEALLAGPVSPIQFLAGKLVFSGSILLALQGLILLLLSQMMHLPIETPPGLIAAGVLLTDLGLLLLGLLCSLIALLTRHRATLLAGMLWPLALPMVLLAMLTVDPSGRYENGWLILAGVDIVLLGLWPGLLKLITGK
jgi:ABC-type transport system involved in cytochrome c biogenesis permease component